MTEGRRGLDVERRLEDLEHRQADPAEDDAVDRHAEIKSAEAAQERGGLARVAQLGELDVGHDARTAPQAAKKNTVSMPLITKFHHSQLPAMPFFDDQAGDDQRRVGRKSRGDHRRARQPPGGVAAGEKEFARAASGAAGVIQPDQQVGGEVEGDDGPVEGT